MRRRGLLTFLSLILGVGALAAANTSVAASPETERKPAELASRPDGSIPFEVDDSMRQWALDEVGPKGSRGERLYRLLEALVGPNGLDITYNAGRTGTAREVFATGEANCLGFTHLFVGLGRALGVDVEYLRVHDVQRIERQGAYVVVSGHVSAGYNIGPEYKILDFSETPVEDYRHVEVIQDQSVVALHHVNRGAELMLDDQWDLARSWLDKGIELDPELPEGWVNLGVYLRRHGDLEGAEAAYRKAIDLDPHFTAPYQNLAALLLSDAERRDEALDLLDIAARNKARNPYLFLSLGDLARDHGRLEIAGDYYKRAKSLAPTDAEMVASMGLWAEQVDKERKARRLLRKARKLDSEHPRVIALAGRLPVD